MKLKIALRRTLKGLGVCCALAVMIVFFILVIETWPWVGVVLAALIVAAAVLVLSYIVGWTMEA